MTQYSWIDQGSLQPNHLNEVATLSAVQDVTIPSECSEEAAASIVPKEEVVEEVSNEEVVEEAWQVVNENFLDARHNFWSSDAWLVRFSPFLILQQFYQQGLFV